MIDLSIVIPTFNRCNWLIEAVNSCLQITKFTTQIIIVDDGSSDGTKNLVWNNNNINFIQQNHTGGNSARNKGLSLAKGRYIKFLDDDDWLIKEGVEAQIEFMDQNGCDISYGNIFVYDERQPIVQIYKVQKYQIDKPLEELLSHWSNAPFSYMIRQEILHNVFWDETLIGLQDFDFILKATEKAKSFKYLDSDIGMYRIHNMSSVMKKDPLQRCYNLLVILDNALIRISDSARIEPDLNNALAHGYYNALRILYQRDREKYREVKTKIKHLDPNFIPKKYVKRIDTVGVSILGLEKFEIILHIRRRILNIFTGYLDE